MTTSASALRRRRHKNPVREARRQAHLPRMQRRVIDYVPRYRELTNGREVTGQVYLGHVAIHAVPGR